MLQRLYVHNFRCFENFEFKPDGESSLLLLGKNGSGKSTVRQVLAVFQAIGRGKGRAGELLKPSDFTLGRVDTPMRFELEVLLDGRTFHYSLALELPERFRELRIHQERLVVDGEPLFSRELAEVTVNRAAQGREDSIFSMDWHLVALPVINDAVATNAMQKLRDWMAGMVLLAPIPQQMTEVAQGADFAISQNADNMADWLGSLLEGFPAAYMAVIEQLQQVMPDLFAFRFERLGRDARALMVQFKRDNSSFELPFTALSDGEKCFFLGAVLLAANKVSGPIFAFWDEPDNYLAPHEVSQFIVGLKRSFLRHSGQLITSSHNPQAILGFAVDSTWVLGRRSHLEPTQLRNLDELQMPEPANEGEAAPTLMQRLLNGDIDPWL